MADGEVKINTKLDTSGVDKGVNELKKKLNDTGKAIDNNAKNTKNLDKNLGGMSKTALATAGAVAGVAVAVKKTVDVLNDCAAAYKVQQKAEIALQTAAKNNPYLNNESVQSLKNFASELQKTSEIGDEVSLQIMSQLAAAGRNEDQIMQIMSAAADMAAITGEDIASAAQKLNATLNGNAGTLGRQIDSINNLTKAELESGKAIELVAQQYKGGAAEMADVGVQLNNAWGDFKENIGRGWDNVTKPVKEFFLGVLNDINEAQQKTADMKAAKAAGDAGTETAAQAKLNYDAAAAELAKMDKFPGMTERKGYGIMSGYMPDSNWQTKRDAQAAKVEELKTRYEELIQAEKDEAEAQEKAAEAADKAAAAKTRDQNAADYIAANKKALVEQIEQIRLKAELTGEEVDAGEMYNAYMQSYIDLITKSNGLVSENNSAAKERLALLQQWAEKARDATTEEERLAAAEKAQAEAEALLKETGGLGYSSIYDDFINREQELATLKEQINNSEVLNEKEKAAAILKVDEEMLKNRRNLWANVASEVTGYAQQVNEIIQDAAALASETEKNRMQAELDNLEILYRKGELSEEEYQEKVAAAKKKGAQTQYQIEMAQWASNLLMATANTAVGVTQALAQGGVAGIITGALVGAAGAVQLASIMAAKPIKHFATGGFVGGMNGVSMGADNTTIAARTGELVLNGNQQRALWDMLNAGTGSGGDGGVNLTINNSAANVVSAQPQINRNEIEIMIDARVNDSLRNGRYNGSLNAAQAGMTGDYYGL